MSKNKKGKIIPLKPVQLSPANYIKTNARSLPIAECVINEDWQSAGIANIIVARKHKNGNITAGIYLVDMYCLGLKDTDYQFNLYPDDYDYFKNVYPGWEHCEYALAHNIIYGAIAFAEEYGFKPHKDFSTAQFILEQDDEQVELMEMEFGLDGTPYYIQGPYDDEAKISQIINTLKRTAGDGNFTVIREDELEDDEFEDDIDPEELGDFLLQESDEAFKSYVKVFMKVNTAFDELIRTPAAKKILKQSPIGTGYEIGEVDADYDDFDSIEQENECKRLSDIAINDDNYELAINETLQAIKKYPGKPVFYNLLQFAYTFNDQFDEAEKVIEEVYRLYPDYLVAKVSYANLLIDRGLAHQVLQVFNGKADLDHIYPARKVFGPGETAAYYACMCRYFIAVDNIDSADLYMNAIIKNDLIEGYGQTVLKIVIDELCEAKIEKMKVIVG